MSDGNEMNNEKTVRFRFQGKQLYVTVPKSTIDAKAFVQNCKVEWPNSLHWVVCSEEKHKDGTDHLHAVIGWKTCRDFRGFAELDRVCGKHGNYRKVRGTLGRLLQYVIKEGKYVQHGEINVKKVIESFAGNRKRKRGKFYEASVMILDGKSIQDLKVWDSGFTLQHLHKLKKFKVDVERFKVAFRTLKPWRPLVYTQEDHLWDQKIAAWLNRVLHNPLTPHTVLPQLWLWGKPGTGKSSLITRLHDYARIYYVSRDKWDDDYKDHHYDIIVCDDFKSQKDVSWLKKMSDGFTHPFIRRNVGTVIKRDCLPMIVTSNFTIEQCFKDMHDRDALNRRFIQVHVGGFINTLWPEYLQTSEPDLTTASRIVDTLYDEKIMS